MKTECNMLASDIFVVAVSRHVQTDRNAEYSITGFRMYRFDDERNLDKQMRTYRGVVHV